MKLIMENWKKKLKEGFAESKNEAVVEFFHYVAGDGIHAVNSAEELIPWLVHVVSVWIQVKKGMIDPQRNSYLNAKVLYDGVTTEEITDQIISEAESFFSEYWDVNPIRKQKNKIIHAAKEKIRKEITKEIEKLSSLLEDL